MAPAGSLCGPDSIDIHFLNELSERLQHTGGTRLRRAPEETVSQAMTSNPAGISADIAQALAESQKLMNFVTPGGIWAAHLTVSCPAK